MKAIQMRETGGPDVLRLVELPDPRPGPDEVLIRVEAAGVNFMDLKRRKGMPYDLPTPLPFIPGAEVAGTVVALGEGVANWQVGARVFGPCGPLANAGWAELTTARADSVFPVPPGMNAMQAAGLSVAGLSAAVLMIHAAEAGAGETVFVPAAAGGLGSFAVQIAKALGATVIAGAGTAEKRNTALALGADHAVDYRGQGWTEEVKKLTDGVGIDIALETVGPKHLGETLSILAPFGRLINYGSMAGFDDPVDQAALTGLLFDPAPCQSLIAFNIAHWLTLRPQVVFAAAGQLLGWLADGTVTGPRITSLPLSEASKALTLLERGESTGKLILIP